jgi:xylan 1,4-beta-xylosidase
MLQALSSARVCPNLVIVPLMPKSSGVAKPYAATRRRWLAFSLGAWLALLLFAAGAVAQTAPQSSAVLVLDASAPAHPFPHFWEQMFGSGRAVLSLRESYRDDLRAVKQVTDFRMVRFHAIFHDEIGLYSEDDQGRPVYNFSYVDQVYDGLLANGVRPFVEISFMPKALAEKPTLHAFWYKQNVSPPKDWQKWDDLITHFVRHLVDRYGAQEVAKWYFEVWNEPNIDFWTGEPKQATYFELYDHTAKAAKAVDPDLRIGGPATAAAAWVADMIEHCSKNGIPLDFVSSHAYGNDRAEDVFGSDEKIPRDQMVYRAIRKVHDQIKASARPNLPLVWSEFNASYKNETSVTDSVYMGPWLANTVRLCDGLVDLASYWTFSDVFEEQGVVKKPFYGGYGLIAAGGIAKPAFAAFQLLHELGDERVELNSDSALLTRRRDGSLVVALWNYAPPSETVPSKTVTLEVRGRNPRHALVARVDSDHGDFHSAYQKMGEPIYPTASQLAELKQAVKLAAPEVVRLRHGQLSLIIPSSGLAIVVFR